MSEFIPVKIIILSKKYGHCRSFNLGLWSGLVLLIGFIALISLPILHLAGHITGKKSLSDLLDYQVQHVWARHLSDQEELIAQTRQEADGKLTALTLRLAELQARLVRVDALGGRLTSMAKLDGGEFDFSQPPAVGGPEVEASGGPFAQPTFAQALDELAQQIDSRQSQLETLEALLANRKLEKDVFVAGRPVIHAYVSSHFGRRTDPFSGKVAFHAGVDFAGKEGADIIAVASGVVTYAAEENGYGLMVEIKHGKGFRTRYGHCQKSLVKVGDIVKKGQVVALLGNTGRSTSPHVHFEVYKNDVAVNPSSYIDRASR
jgi:murein DD-endopeptidase MepM/ murein hydrolase activator NlpD